MDIIQAYRSTLLSFLGTDNNKLLITNKYGIQLIRNVFNAKEFLNMRISGTCLIDDLLPSEKCEGYDFVIFLEDSNVDKILPILSTYDNKLYIYFYTPISRETMDILIESDKKYIISDLAYCPLNFIPISQHCAVGNVHDIFSIMRSVPSSVYGHAEDISFSEHIIQKCEDMTTLFSSPNKSNSLLVLNRNYDKLVSVLIPWRYESMLHFHDIKLEYNGFGDELYEQIRYEPYDFVSNEIRKKAKEIKAKIVSKDDIIDATNHKRQTKLVTQHLNALVKLDKYINDNDVFNKSELEQKALIRAIRKNDMKEHDTRVVNAIFESNKFNLQEGSIYMQFVPRIATIVDEIIKGKKISGITDKPIKNPLCVYIYVKEYISYEEVATIENMNKMYKATGITFFLLSDNVLGYWHYLPITSKDKTHSTLRINRITQNFVSLRNARHNIMPKPINAIQMSDEIADCMNKLKEYTKVNFGMNNECGHELIDKITMYLNIEYNKVKSIIPNNPLEENDKKIELIKLNKIATDFKILSAKYEKIYGKKNADDYAEYDSRSKLINETDVDNLDQMQVDNEQLRILNERDEGLRELTDKYLELHKTFIDLQLLVNNQDEMIDSIEMNIIKSSDFVSGAVRQLEKAKSHSKLGTKLIGGIAAAVGAVAVTIGLTLGIKLT